MSTENPNPPSFYNDRIYEIDGNLHRYSEAIFFNRVKLYISPSKPASNREKASQELLRNIIEHVLCWTPQEAYEHLTEQKIRQLKLENLIEFCFPPDTATSLVKNRNFLFNTLYPRTFKFDEFCNIANAWKEVRRGKKKWPAWILGTNNLKCETYIFQLFEEFLYVNFPMKSIEQLYAKFSDSAYVNNLMKTQQVYDVFKPYYDYPVDLFHSYLRRIDERRMLDYKPLYANELLYMKYRYRCIAKHLSKAA